MYKCEKEEIHTKDSVKRVIRIVLAIIFVIVVAAAIVFRNELGSLASLKRVDDYGMYTMSYSGDYGFDEFLKTGAKSDSDIEAFVVNRLLKGLPIDLNVTGAGCTVFTAENSAGERIFCRNFDFDYAPSLQLRTQPKDGYASISTVNLAFAGYSAESLPSSGIRFKNFLTLAAPFLPFDGMNEKGVAIALLAVPEADGGYDPDKVTLNTTTAIRLVLDKAANVKEAVELLKGYSIYFSGDVDCHYLIADSSGQSVLVEFYDGAMRTVEPEENYQIASNFIAYNGLNIGEGFTEFERYDKVKDALEGSGDGLSSEEAMALLRTVGVYGADGTDKLQWSALYNLSTGETQLFAHRSEDNVQSAVLPLT